jgi:hypothetical protein
LERLGLRLGFAWLKIGTAVSTVMNIRFPHKAGISLLSARPLYKGRDEETTKNTCEKGERKQRRIEGSKINISRDQESKFNPLRPSGNYMNHLL